MKSFPAVKRVSSREVYRNPWMSVREDEVVRQDGSPGLYGVVDKPDFALVIQLSHLGDLYGAYGFSSQGFDVYLATGLRAGPTAREHSEQDMRHRRVTEDEFVRMVRQADVVDAATVAAYALLLQSHG